MTIKKLEIVCDRCGFESDDRFDFYDKHFSRISMDGNDMTEYFHLCKKCQNELHDLITYPSLYLKTKTSRYEDVLLFNGASSPDLSGICRVYSGIIIQYKPNPFFATT